MWPTIGAIVLFPSAKDEANAANFAANFAAIGAEFGKNVILASAAKILQNLKWFATNQPIENDILALQ